MRQVELFWANSSLELRQFNDLKSARVRGRGRWISRFCSVLDNLGFDGGGSPPAAFGTHASERLLTTVALLRAIAGVLDEQRGDRTCHSPPSAVAASGFSYWNFIVKAIVEVPGRPGVELMSTSSNFVLSSQIKSRIIGRLTSIAALWQTFCIWSQAPEGCPAS